MQQRQSHLHTAAVAIAMVILNFTVAAADAGSDAISFVEEIRKITMK
jgi:hypothetical protein